MVDRLSESDHTEVTWTRLLTLFAGGTPEVAIDSSKMRIVRAAFTGSKSLLIPMNSVRSRYGKKRCHEKVYIHRLWIFNVDDGKSLGLLRREQAELDLNDLLDRQHDDLGMVNTFGKSHFSQFCA